MKVVPIETRPMLERTNNARPGSYFYNQMLEGDETSPENFTMQLVRTGDAFHSPRHRHNFDQIRLQIEGENSYTRDGSMAPGSVAYFPESTPYGPQKTETDTLIMLLQFGGTGGLGYPSERVYHKAVGEMKAKGVFKDGFYTPAGGDKGKDAFEAVWEHINGRPCEYAPQRYNTAVFMNPQAFDWVPVDGCTGVERKLLGSFTERKVDIAIVRLQAGASLPLSGHLVGFVNSGAGRIGDSPVARHTAIELSAGESAVLKGGSAMLEMLLIDLPPLVRTGQPSGARRTLEPA